MSSRSTVALVVLFVFLSALTPATASVDTPTGGVHAGVGGGDGGGGAGDGSDGPNGEADGEGGSAGVPDDGPDGADDADDGDEADGADDDADDADDDPGDADDADDDGADGGVVGDDACRFALVIQGGRIDGEGRGFDGDARVKLDALGRLGYADAPEEGDAAVVHLTAPTLAELEAAVEALRERIDACEAAGTDAELLVFATGHGWALWDRDGDVIDRGFLLSDGPGERDEAVLYPDTLAALLADLRAAGLDEAYLEFSSCYSGQFVEPLSNVSDGTATAASAAGICNGLVRLPGDPDDPGDDYEASTFETAFLSALAGGWPNGSRPLGLPRNTADPSTADADGDGNVTWAEAFDYANRTMANSSADDDPQWGGPCEECRYVLPAGDDVVRFERLDRPFDGVVAGPRIAETRRVGPTGPAPVVDADVDPGALPGRLAYPVDRLGERVELAVAFGPRAASRIQLRHAAERLAEARALDATDEPSRVAGVLPAYAAAVDGARASLARHEAAGGRDDAERRLFAASLAGHEPGLDDLSVSGVDGVDRAVDAREAGLAWSRDGGVRLAEPTRQLLAAELSGPAAGDLPLPDGEVELLIRDPAGTAVATAVVRDGRVVTVRDGAAGDPVATSTLSSATAGDLLAEPAPGDAFAAAVRDGRVTVAVERPGGPFAG